MTAGIDRRTGRILAGWPHVQQSIEVIFTTPVGRRIMREWFGFPLHKLLGENLTPVTIFRFVHALVVGIELCEPRFKVRRVFVDTDADRARSGNMSLSILGDYRPRALQGDFSVEGPRSIIISGNDATGIEVA